MTGFPVAAWPLTDRDGEVDRLLAALSDPDRSAVVLHGPAGVGKTRLADTCLTLAESAGRRVARVTASRAAALLPLGTLASILPAALDPHAPPAATFSQARDELLAAGAGERLILLVDDAHLLDTSSAVLLTQLLDARAVFVLATIRDGEAVIDAVASWWRRPHTLRLDLTDLDREATADLLATVLAGVVATDTTQRLHHASGGNPLILRELVTQAREGNQLSDASGTWRLTGPIPVSRRLSELLAPRLAGLDPAARTILDQIAVCGPLAVDELTGDATPSALEALEHCGLIQVLVEGSRHRLTPGHPLMGETLRSDVPLLRRRTILLDTASRVESLGAQRREDTRRIATWRLDAGGNPDRDLLLHAARFARYAYDFEEVERLSAILWADQRTAEIAVLLGEAHYELGHFEEADEILAADLPDDSPSDLLVQRAMLRASTLQFGLADWELALAVIREAREELGAEHTVDLLCQEGQLWNSIAEPLRALQVVEQIEPETARDRVLLALVRAQALSRSGLTAEAIDVATEGYREHSALTEPIALVTPGIHFIHQVAALNHAGRFAECDQLAQLGYDGAVAGHIPFGQIYIALLAGNSCLQQGRIHDARRWYQEAASTAQANGFSRPEGTARAGIAGTEAMLGNAGAAQAAARHSRALPAQFGQRFDDARGLAWAAWQAEGAQRAQAMLVESAAEAQALGNVGASAYLWHDAARLGATGVAGHLAALAELGDSPVVAALAAHVTALEARDAAGLAEASATFEDLGMVVVAAEAAAAAAEAYAIGGLAREAAAWSTKRNALAERCPGVVTPGLVALESSTPLTSREREVADLAGRGLSSQEIADRLFLSIRTVNNHLGNVYAKLGLRGREELAEALHSS